VLRSVWLGSRGKRREGTGRSRGDQQSFLHISAEKRVAVLVLMSSQSGRSPCSHLANPVVLVLVQTTPLPLHSALFLFTRQYLLFSKYQFLQRWNQARKHSDVPGNAARDLKVVVEHTISAAESPGLPKGQGTADKCVLTQDMPGELGRPGEIPICMQASQHASKAVTAWYLFSSDGDRSHVLR